MFLNLRQIKLLSNTKIFSKAFRRAVFCKLQGNWMVRLQGS